VSGSSVHRRRAPPPAAAGRVRRLLPPRVQPIRNRRPSPGYPFLPSNPSQRSEPKAPSTPRQALSRFWGIVSYGLPHRTRSWERPGPRRQGRRPRKATRNPCGPDHDRVEEKPTAAPQGWGNPFEKPLGGNLSGNDKLAAPHRYRVSLDAEGWPVIPREARADRVPRRAGARGLQHAPADLRSALDSARGPALAGRGSGGPRAGAARAPA
jgi:hypothetical protein